jgi:hypothetical protein
MATNLIVLGTMAADATPHAATVVGNGVVSVGNAVASSTKSTGKKIKKFFGRR